MNDFEAFVDGLELRYFKGREFTAYWSKKRGGVQNSPPPRELWGNIVPTLIVLDAIRHKLGYAITLNSTYRSKAYNKAVGGEPNSFHMRFQAIDFTGAGGTPKEWAEAAQSMRGRTFYLPDRKPFVFRGGIGTYATFVHIDTRGYDANWRG